MGEAKDRELAVRQQVVEALGLETAGGKIKVRWDRKGQATAQGQMAFFIEFLTPLLYLISGWRIVLLTTRVPTDQCHVISSGHGCCRYSQVTGVMRM